MEELRLMVCPLVGVENLPIEDDWKQTACVECGADIHLTPDARRMIHEKQAMPVCGPCSVKLTTAEGAFLQDVIPLGNVSAEDAAEAKELYQKAQALARLRSDPEIMDSFMGDVDEIIKAADNDMDNFEALKLTAAAAAKHMPPDGEWGSICVMENWEGDIFPPVPIGEMMGKGMPKEVIARQILPAMIHACDGKRVLFGISSWMVQQKGKNGEFGPIAMPESGSLADHPDAREALVLIDITADGVQQMASSIIERDGINPPKLGEWKDVPAPGRSDGLFLQSVIPTLQLVRTLRGESVGT